MEGEHTSASIAGETDDAALIEFQRWHRLAALRIGRAWQVRGEMAVHCRTGLAR